MKGLIIKDILLIKNNLNIFLVMLVGFIFLSFNEISNVSFILLFFCIMICISTFSYDEFNKWDAYAITFPAGKQSIVKNKYLATLLLVGICFAISLIITIGIALFKDNLNLINILELLFGNLTGLLLIVSVMYPLLYKFGAEKGRMFLFIGSFIIMGVVALLTLIGSNLNIDISSFLNFINDFGFIIFPSISIVSLYISYLISTRIYNKKEF